MKQELKVEDDKLKQILSDKREVLDNYIIAFKDNYVKYKVDKFGNEEAVYNPYAITVFFFASINPVKTVEPTYTCEQLCDIWEVFMEYIEKINMEIGVYSPTISTFAKFSGLSLLKLQNLRKSEDESMRVVVNRIFDEVYNSNIMLTQSKDLTAGATQYRMKYENEALEKSNPNVNVQIKTKELDLEDINRQLYEIGRIAENRTGLIDE